MDARRRIESLLLGGMSFQSSEFKACKTSRRNEIIYCPILLLDTLRVRIYYDHLLEIASRRDATIEQWIEIDSGG